MIGKNSKPRRWGRVAHWVVAGATASTLCHVLSHSAEPLEIRVVVANSTSALTGGTKAAIEALWRTNCPPGILPKLIEYAPDGRGLVAQLCEICQAWKVGASQPLLVLGPTGSDALARLETTHDVLCNLPDHKSFLEDVFFGVRT